MTVRRYKATRHFSSHNFVSRKSLTLDIAQVRLITECLGHLFRRTHLHSLSAHQRIFEYLSIDMDNNAPKDGIPLEEDDDMCLDLLENTNLFKFNFMKKFAAKTGLLSSLELEELLTQKIAESIKFHTDNADLRERLERHEKINKSNMKRLSIITKQYQNFRMTHNRLVRDLIDRPDAAIVPVKITRDVGLQVYQHAVCSKNVTTPQPAPQHTRIVKKGPALVQRRKPMTGNPPNSNRNMLRITATTNGPEPSTSSNGNTTVPQETPPSFAVWIREGQIPDPQETEIAVVMKPTIAAANRTLDTAPNVVVQCNRKF